MFKKMKFQPTLDDSEDREMERMVNRARITMAAQFYNRDKKERLTEIGAEIKLLAKKTCSIWLNIPHWSQELLDQHAKKVEEN